MKYSVSNRQPKDIIEKADEIIVKEKDYREIPDLFLKYPNKTIILECTNSFLVDKNNIILDFSASSNNFVCKLEELDISIINWLKTNNIKFYYKYPVNTFFDLNELINLGSEYAVITIPLTFQMNLLENLPIKLRMVPNVAYSSYIPRKNGIYGQWVRPEDVKYYENIYVFDFENVDLIEEKTLLHIYKDNQNWPGNLNHLFTNFNLDIDNRGVLEDIGKKRSVCGQRCQINHICDYCKTALNFSNTILQYKKIKQSEQKEEN